jgi:signal transduction histidine kinase
MDGFRLLSLPQVQKGSSAMGSSRFVQGAEQARATERQADSLASSRFVAPVILLVFSVGLAFSTVSTKQATSGNASEFSLRASPFLSGAATCVALVVCWVAYLHWRGDGDVLSGRLALATPCVVWAAQSFRVAYESAKLGTPNTLGNLSRPISPSVSSVAVGVVGIVLLTSHVVSHERALSDSLLLRVLMSVIGVVVGSLGLAVVFRNDPAGHLAFRQRFASTVFPVTCVLLGAHFFLRRLPSRAVLRRCTGGFLFLTAIGLWILAQKRTGSSDVRDLLSTGTGLIGVLLVLVAFGGELRKSQESRYRQLLALELNQAIATDRLQLDRQSAKRQAHDRRSALLSVEAVVRILEDDSATTDMATRRRLGTAAVEELRRLRSFDESSESPAVAATFELSPLLEPLVAVARADGAQIQLVLRADLSVFGVSSAIVDVVRNLISNAIYHGENKEIVVAAHRADYQFVELSVTDSGPGIASARRFDLFEPGRSSGGPGHSGIGLYSARLMLREMGGELLLDRTHTQGARFVARIPAAIEAAKPRVATG